MSDRIAIPRQFVPNTLEPKLAEELARCWDELVRHPDRDGPREVIADILQMAGDPLGEVMALQLVAARAPTAPAVHERVTALLAKHGERWAGSLARHAKHLLFDRGVVQRLQLHTTATTDLLRDPVLATVEVLEHEEGNPTGVYSECIRHPAMVSLREVHVSDGETRDAVERSPAPLTTVWLGMAVGRALDDLLAVCKHRAAITTLGCRHPGTLTFLHTLPWLDRLRAIRTTRLTDALAAWRLMPSLAALSIEQGDDHLELTREPRGVVVRISGEWLFRSLTKALSALPTDLARIELVSLDPSLEQRAREVATLRGIELVVVSPIRRTVRVALNLR